MYIILYLKQDMLELLCIYLQINYTHIIHVMEKVERSIELEIEGILGGNGDLLESGCDFFSGESFISSHLI